MWILIAIAVLATVLYLKMVLRKNSSLLHLNEEEIRDGVKTTKVVSGYESITPYVIGILISQGINVLQ